MGLRMGLPARQWRLRDACGLSVSTTSWRYGLRRTCRLVTGRAHRPRSTWPDQARLALLAVTHRYNRTFCLWLEQFQIESVRPTILPRDPATRTERPVTDHFVDAPYPHRGY